MTMTAVLNDELVFDMGPDGLVKAPTGVKGLDEVTSGGLPKGRTTLIAGGPGSGKTLLGVEFLVHGALDYGEPGVLLAFEESADDLSANVASLGYDLNRMRAERLLVIDSFRLDGQSPTESVADYLGGLFIRLDCAVDSIGAKRVMLDSIDVLFDALDDVASIRAGLTRLFRWLKERDLTAVVTGEKGSGLITRLGIEEYVSDCVITLDHRAHDQISTRRLRVVKYRGSAHGTDEFPFLITNEGIVVLPLTSPQLDHEASTARISTGLTRLDHMLGGGLFRGTSVLVSGEAGTGKTTLAAKIVQSACERGERAVFVSFEESPARLALHMASVGLDLNRWVDEGLLCLWAARPTAHGIEMHLASLLQMIDQFHPSIVALDAMTSLANSGVAGDATSLITREVDLLQSRGITSVMTELTRVGAKNGDAGVSWLMDTWLVLRNIETNGERNRLLFVQKSRGTAHSNQVREFVLKDTGIELLDVSVGPDGAVLGSARLVQEAEKRLAAVLRLDDINRRRDELERLESAGVLRAGVTQTNEDAMGAHRWADDD